MRPIAIVELGVFLAIWLSFGILAFFKIQGWEHEHNRRMEMIQNGEVQPEQLYVVGFLKAEHKGRWTIALGTTKDKATLWREINSPDSFETGQQLEAYRFDDDYLGPQLHTGGFSWGKWVFLGFGFLPIFVLGSIWAVRRVYRICWS
jgi:hypothetical protein